MVETCLHYRLQMTIHTTCWRMKDVLRRWNKPRCEAFGGLALLITIVISLDLYVREWSISEADRVVIGVRFHYLLRYFKQYVLSSEY